MSFPFRMKLLVIGLVSMLVACILGPVRLLRLRVVLMWCVRFMMLVTVNGLCRVVPILNVIFTFGWCVDRRL